MVDFNLINSLNITDEDIEQQLAELGGMEGDITAAMMQETAQHKPGQILQGRIIDIIGNDVIVEVGLKSEGAIELSEFGDVQPNKKGQRRLIEISNRASGHGGDEAQR